MERNANAYSELFYHCVQVLNEYSNTISEETFLEQYFQENKVYNCFSLISHQFFCFYSKVPNETFVSSILFDCIRHSTLLTTITNIFYTTDGIYIRKSEKNIYKSSKDELKIFSFNFFFLVITYLIFFQLDTVGLKLLRGFINSVQLNRMYQV